MVDLTTYHLKQKFRKLTFVKVADLLPESMRHFDSGIVCIVDGTCSQMYRGDDTKSYAVFKIMNGEVVGRSAWYNEDQLTALPDVEQDSMKAEKMIEIYNLGIRFNPMT